MSMFLKRKPTTEAEKQSDLPPMTSAGAAAELKLPKGDDYYSDPISGVPVAVHSSRERLATLVEAAANGLLDGSNGEAAAAD